jgi:hypothetical protein
LLTVPFQLGQPCIGKVDDPLGNRIAQIGEQVLPNGEQLVFTDASLEMLRSNRSSASAAPADNA